MRSYPKDLELRGDVTSSSYYKALPRREQEVLMYNIATGNEGDFAFDLSQTIGRNTKAHDGIFQTLTPRMVNWLVQGEQL